MTEITISGKAQSNILLNKSNIISIRKCVILLICFKQNTLRNLVIISYIPNSVDIDNCNHCITAPTSQSGVTVMQSHDNQPRQDDERSQVEINNGMCIQKYTWNCQ